MSLRERHPAHAPRRPRQQRPGLARRHVPQPDGAVAAPLVALAYVFAGPFVGLGVLAWMATRAATGYRAA